MQKSKAPQHPVHPSLVSRRRSKRWTISRIVDTMPWNRLPKQIDPNEYVRLRATDCVTAEEQHPCAESLSKHHVAMTPATVT